MLVREMAELLTEEGPGKGYYTLPGSLIREQVRDDVEIGERDLYQAMKAWQLSLSKDEEMWYRYSPGPDKRIRGFNRSYLPFIDGFYYVRKNPQINLRQQLYALETKQVPASGNTETFNRELSKVVVPPEWCPYYLDPCPEDWCEACKNRQPPRAPAAQREDLLTLVYRWMVLGLLALMVAAIVTAAFQ